MRSAAQLEAQHGISQNKITSGDIGKIIYWRCSNERANFNPQEKSFSTSIVIELLDKILKNENSDHKNSSSKNSYCLRGREAASSPEK